MHSSIDFWDLSLEVPESNKVNSDPDAKPLTFPEIVAKLTIHGITPQQIGKMTKKQLFYAIEAINEESKFRVRLAGGEVPEEDHIATLQDLMAFGM